MDIVDPNTRSRMMRAIRGTNTEPELAVRRALHKAGLRFRVHVRTLPGTPDILLPKYRAAVLVHGCFWHRHPGCRFTTTPRSREEFWQAKFLGTVERDERQLRALGALGWSAHVIWECETHDSERHAKLVAAIRALA